MADTLTLSTPDQTSSLEVVVEGYADLQVLLQALMEAKFRAAGSDSEIFGSPLLATIANRTVAALIADEKERGKFSEAKWKKWRQLDPSRREWKIIVKHVRQIRGKAPWSSWNTVERGRYLDDVASPLTLEGPHRDTLLRELAE